MLTPCSTSQMYTECWSSKNFACYINQSNWNLKNSHQTHFILQKNEKQSCDILWNLRLILNEMGFPAKDQMHVVMATYPANSRYTPTFPAYPTPIHYVLHSKHVSPSNPKPNVIRKICMLVWKIAQILQNSSKFRSSSIVPLIPCNGSIGLKTCPSFDISR